MKNNSEYLSEQELLVELLKEVKEIKDNLNDSNKATTINFDYVDNYDLMRLLKVNARTLANWRKQGLIKHIKMGGKIYYSLAEVQKMMSEKFNSTLSYQR